MIAPDATLFLVGPGPDPSDPLDAIAAVKGHLAGAYGVIEDVGLDTGVSLRSLRRRFRTDIDRVLYDFSRPDDMGWALSELHHTRGLALTSAAGWPLVVTGPTRAERRYRAYLNAPVSGVAVLGLDALHVGADVAKRPIATPLGTKASFDLALFCGHEDRDVIYRVLRASTDQRVLIVVQTASEVAPAQTIAMRVRPDVKTEIRAAHGRAARAWLASMALRAIECDETLWPGISDVEFAARTAGRTYARARSVAHAAHLVRAKWPLPEGDFADGREIATFAAKLVDAIELARRAQLSLEQVA